jgi:hypothetical protein
LDPKKITNKIELLEVFITVSLLMDRYEKLDQVGEGTYGIVYRANDLLTGEIVALKRIPIKGDEVVL